MQHSLGVPWLPQYHAAATPSGPPPGANGQMLRMSTKHVVLGARAQNRTCTFESKRSRQRESAHSLSAHNLVEYDIAVQRPTDDESLKPAVERAGYTWLCLIH